MKGWILSNKSDQTRPRVSPQRTSQPPGGVLRRYSNSRYMTFSFFRVPFSPDTGRGQPSLIFNPGKAWLVIVLCLLGSPLLHAITIGEDRYVDSAYHPGDFSIVTRNAAATLLVDSADFPGVVRAVNDLQADIERVTNHTTAITHDENNLGSNVIVVGTVGKSKIIDQLIRDRKIDVTPIAGKWESFLIRVVPKPLPGVASALIIAGSDKRGTIYGIYDLSDQIGVSPWYWWADVPVQHHDEFYAKVFELLLRLKANYLWPAMWNNAFNEDDPLNAQLANEYGIVMGTSHHEPMLRAQQEWKRHGKGPWDYSKNAEVLTDFWSQGIERNKKYESVITLGMRGDGDLPMSESANIALLEKIVADQRKIIADRVNPDLSKVPQDWALYKEVQEYYEKGMRVPDDVTLLWCDDNWGNLRRLPTPEERKRNGGAGIYYHFDYVGDPRSYKWLNTIPIAKIWEQMNLAYHYGADRIWIVNVGDLKPMELPIDFFLNMAWKPEKWPKEKISEFTRLWAERQFGPQFAPEIAELLSKYTKYNGRRKPELLEPGTFSLVDYREADTVFADFQTAVAKAEEIYAKLPENQRDAFFELVLYPTKASAIVTELYITAGRNHLYASQGRASANESAAAARALFQADADLSAYYNHTLAHGKWDHMMDQTHIGYTSWNQPPVNVMPKVTEIEIPAPAQLGVAIEGSTLAWPGSLGEPTLPPFDLFNQQRRYIDIFNRGREPFVFSATTSVPWIMLSESQGTIEKDRRVWVSVDWTRAPLDFTSGSLKIARGSTQEVVVNVNAFRPQDLTRESLDGFVESDRYVSMEAVHYSKKVDGPSARWEKIDDLGRTLSSMSVFPVTAESVTPSRDSPRLEYKLYLFDPRSVEVEAILAPTLNFVPGRGLRYAISFDDEAPQVIDALAQNSVEAWGTSVKDSVRKVRSTHLLAKSGYHTLKVWMVDPGVVLQKLVVNLGGVKPSYLGPPESYRRVGSEPVQH